MDFYITPSAAISPVRPAAGDKLFSSEAHTTPAAIPRLYIYFHFIDEIHEQYHGTSFFTSFPCSAAKKI
jgi:hypothetical protein